VEKIDEGGISWICRAKINEFTDTVVEDIAFCPKNHGLKLATVLLNGKLKIFEPTEYSTYHNWYLQIQLLEKDKYIFKRHFFSRMFVYFLESFDVR